MRRTSTYLVSVGAASRWGHTKACRAFKSAVDGRVVKGRCSGEPLKVAETAVAKLCAAE